MGELKVIPQLILSIVFEFIVHQCQRNPIRELFRLS
jgi:hypothetical protein